MIPTFSYRQLSFRLTVLLFFSLAAASAQSLTVLNAASFSGGTIAPGSILTIYGTNLTAGTAAVEDAAHPPATLGGTQVSIGGVPAALFYVSPTQINAVASTSTPVGSQTLTVVSGSRTNSSTVTIGTNGAPGLFSLSGTGTHDGAIVDAITGRIGAVKATTPVSTTFLALFLTGANFSTAPVVTIAGVSVPVTFYGASPCCAGMQQINISIPAALAGSGRVPVMVRTGTTLSNVVEIVLLPAKGKGEFADDAEDGDRSRELSGIATIPASSLALVTDENDDLVRVVDVSQKKIVRSVVLPANAEPVAIAVNATGTRALVAERGLGRVAFIDLAAFTVLSEVPVGFGPVAIAINGNIAVVVNGDNNSVSILDINGRTVTGTVPVGAGARGVAIDSANRAYVTNQSAGTISVIDLATAKVTNTISLGAARPAGIQILPGSSLFAVVTDPATSDDGRVLLVNLSTGAVTPFSVNVEHSGGSGDVVVVGSTAYIANSSGGSISILPLAVSGATVTGVPTVLKIGSGVRALAVDAKDNLLLAVTESTGEVVLVSLASGQVTGRFTGVAASEKEVDDHGDRENSANAPAITSISPGSAKINSTFVLTVTGVRLQGVSEVNFASPGKSEDHGGKGRGSGNSGRDSSIGAASIQVNAAGTQLTATVTVSRQAAAGPRVVYVSSPNGESSSVQSSGNAFTVVP